MILQDSAGRCTIVDIAVGMDTGALQAKLAQLLPAEKAIQVTSAADSLVLSGMVSDAGKVDQAILLATAYVRGTLDKGRVVAGGQGGWRCRRGTAERARRQSAGGRGTQQVLLEVKVAEVSKALIDKLGASLNLQRINGSWTYSILTNFLTGGAGLIDAFRSLTGEFVTIDGEKKDGLVKILAEPNLMAISGQEGSFLAGGKVFLPVLTNNNLGLATYTLQEEDFGVGLKFTPTVLEGGLHQPPGRAGSLRTVARGDRDPVGEHARQDDPAADLHPPRRDHRPALRRPELRHRRADQERCDHRHQGVPDPGRDPDPRRAVPQHVVPDRQERVAVRRHAAAGAADGRPDAAADRWLHRAQPLRAVPRRPDGRPAPRSGEARSDPRSDARRRRAARPVRIRNQVRGSHETRKSSSVRQSRQRWSWLPAARR